MNSPVPTKIIAAAIAFLIAAGVGAPRGDAARAAEPQSAGADVVAVKAVTYCFSDTIGVTGYLVPREEAIVNLDADGYLWLLGRVDDIMLVSGHNISTTEVESALVDHPSVAEAAVVGKTDDTTGQAIAAFVTLRAGVEPRDELVEELRNHVAELIGPIAKPKSILFTEELPKTRSGKIMRRLLRNVAEDDSLGDTTTLADPTVVDGIKSRYLATAPAEE